jgi:hypothetical protein
MNWEDESDPILVSSQIPLRHMALIRSATSPRELILDSGKKSCFVFVSRSNIPGKKVELVLLCVAGKGSGPLADVQLGYDPRQPCKIKVTVSVGDEGAIDGRLRV